jgi:hypothetical protein
LRQAGQTLSALTDVFSNAAREYLASFPNGTDRRRFIETARKALEYSDAFKGMPVRKRRTLTKRPIETGAQEQELVSLLSLMIAPTVKQSPGDPDETSRQRARIARGIRQGLSPDVRKAELIEIERDLLKLYDALAARKNSKQNKINRQKVADHDGERRRLVVEKLNTIKNKALTKNARAKHILGQLPGQYRRTPQNPNRIWTPGAFIKWARRRKIEI